MTDGLFNFPPAPFLYVHTAEVLTPTTGEWTSDENGYPIEQPADKVVTRAYVATPRQSRDGRTDRVDCVVLVPNDVIVVPSCIVVVPQQSPILPNLIGQYKIADGGIRPNPLHTRLLLTRPQNPSLQDTNASVLDDD